MDREISDELEIIIPLDHTEAYAFQILIQKETAKAIQTGQLQPRSFPNVRSLTPQTVLHTLDSMLEKLTKIEIEVATKSFGPAWLEQLLKRIRLPLHQAIYFYVKKAIQQQYIINRELLKALHAIARNQGDLSQVQQKEIKQLRAELDQLKHSLALSPSEKTEVITRYDS